MHTHLCAGISTGSGLGVARESGSGRGKGGEEGPGGAGGGDRMDGPWGLPKSPSTLSPTHLPMVPSSSRHPYNFSNLAALPVALLTCWSYPMRRVGGPLPFLPGVFGATQSILKQQPLPPQPHHPQLFLRRLPPREKGRGQGLKEPGDVG